MTTESNMNMPESCPVEGLLKSLSGKWKPQIFRFASVGPLRFNALLRQLPQSNKQSIALALRELEEAQLLVKTIVQEKPLHIEYNLSERGRAMLGVFEQLEGMLLENN
ncbi:MAG: helix-turn-helix transcriptional regulator [Bacteroidetes bacterium]|nr:helix-turn-helix transcriptional regulator [Bacteroidota bacterium]